MYFGFLELCKFWMPFFGLVPTLLSNIILNITISFLMKLLEHVNSPSSMCVKLLIDDFL